MVYYSADYTLANLDITINQEEARILAEILSGQKPREEPKVEAFLEEFKENLMRFWEDPKNLPGDF